MLPDDSRGSSLAAGGVADNAREGMRFCQFFPIAYRLGRVEGLSLPAAGPRHNGRGYWLSGPNSNAVPGGRTPGTHYCADTRPDVHVTGSADAIRREGRRMGPVPFMSVRAAVTKDNAEVVRGRPDDGLWVAL